VKTRIALNGRSCTKGTFTPHCFSNRKKVFTVLFVRHRHLHSWFYVMRPAFEGINCAALVALPIFFALFFQSEEGLHGALRAPPALTFVVLCDEARFRQLCRSGGATYFFARWLSDGRRRGREYLARNTTKNDRRAGSFSINLVAGAWADFATDEKGGDVASLFAYLRRIRQADAARELARPLQVHAGEVVVPRKGGARPAATGRSPHETSFCDEPSQIGADAASQISADDASGEQPELAQGRAR
jgi:hypothetical protein